MLVTIRNRDEGSAIVSVLIVMLVLTITGLALAAIVSSTSSGLAGSRDTAQSRAAADAGLAAAVAEARLTGRPCGMDISSTVAPEYTVRSTCASGRVTFTVTGEGQNGGTTKTEAVFSYTSGTTGMGADMIFFGDTTFSHEVITHAPLDDSLLSIVIPTGDFTCMAPIPANLVLAGDFLTKGSCDIGGGVLAGGETTMATDSDAVRGSLTTAGPSENTIRGTVDGDVHTRGGIAFGWGSKTIGGDVTAGGDVALGSARITGTLTVPEDNKITMNSGLVSGGTARPATVTPPTAPEFAKWFDYRYSLSDWQPYEGRTFTPRTLSATGTGGDTCAAFNSHPATGWKSLEAHTSPRVLDARACTKLSSNSGTQPTVQLKSDLVLLAKSFDLTKLTFTAAPGTSPRVWFIVEDTVDDDRTTCSGGAGDIFINGTVMSTSITAMAYTPCTIDIGGMGNDTWKGSFYGGRFDYGGGLNFYGAPIALPGMPSTPIATDPDAPSDAVMGDLISQRDIP